MNAECLKTRGDSREIVGWFCKREACLNVFLEFEVTKNASGCRDGAPWAVERGLILLEIAGYGRGNFASTIRRVRLDGQIACQTAAKRNKIFNRYGGEGWQ